MYITFRDERQRCNFENIKWLTKRYGEQNARLLVRRLQELKASENLEQLMQSGIGRIERLKGNLKGKLSMRIDGKLRLLFEPVFEEGQETLSAARIDKIRIMSVVDYHD
jgi:plasmid maintenance system killer protein